MPETPSVKPVPTQSTPESDATTPPAHPVDTDVQEEAAHERAENGGYN